MQDNPKDCQQYIRTLMSQGDLVQHPLKIAPKTGKYKGFPDVYFFDPVNWEETSFFCPYGHGTLKAKKSFADFGKAKPRVIYGPTKNIWLVSRLLKCKQCKSPYLSHDRSVLSQLNEDIVLDFVLFHSSGWTRSLFNDIVNQAANGLCFSKIASVLEGRKKTAICDVYYENKDLAQIVSSHFEYPAFKSPKVNQLEDCFLYFFKGIQSEIHEEFKSVESKYLSVDHTYSIA